MITAWLTRLLEYPGFRDWKAEVARRQITFALLPRGPVDPYGDFEFDRETLREHDVVAGYMRLLGAANDCRTTKHYFQRYPFRNLQVSREEHVRTCCELYFSRVYQFHERLNRLLVWIARRTEPKGLDVDHLKKVFKDQLGVELEARHRIHHEAAYSDFEIDALRATDLLSIADGDYPRMSDANYRSVTRQWGQRVDATADKLDFWVGVVAVLMLVRCRFLADPREPSTAMDGTEKHDGGGETSFPSG